MKLGIMQPYFFPYMGHFSLIAAVDSWVVFDVTQYTPKSWMNRNRILHPKEGWQYITVPLNNSSTSIKTLDANVFDLLSAKVSVLGKLSHYKKKAPYYSEVIKVVERAFDSVEGGTLVSLNVSALKVVCEYLNIPFFYKICSELSLDYPADLMAGDWAPFICNALGATEYVNPVAGKSIFDLSKFKKYGISLYFYDYKEFKYDVVGRVYEPHLSILDVMMWNSPAEIKSALLQEGRLVKVM
jgi:hypothetical protein